MKTDIGIYSVGLIQQQVISEPVNLKPKIKTVFGQHIRRIDRFIQMSLIGAQCCKADFDPPSAPSSALPPETGVYLASGHGPIGMTETVLHKIYQQNEPPKPFNFVNMVSNTANYYIADILGFESVSLFVASGNTSFESSLRLAVMDLNLDVVPFALVGSTDECPKALARQRQRLQLDDNQELGEGSAWLTLGKRHPEKEPIATLTLLARFKKLDEVFETVGEIIDLQDCHVAATPWLRDAEKNLLSEQYKNSELISPVEIFGYSLSLAGIMIANYLLNQADEKPHLLHINKDEEGIYEVILLSGHQ